MLHRAAPAAAPAGATWRNDAAALGMPVYEVISENWARGPTLCNNICPCACVGACKHLIGNLVQMLWIEHCLFVIKYYSSLHVMVTPNSSSSLQPRGYHVTHSPLENGGFHISHLCVKGLVGDLVWGGGGRLNEPVLTSAVSLKTWRCKKLSNSVRDRMTKH